MEPVAPGTEDDNQQNYNTSLTKQEKEIERLLNLKAFLPNRQYGKIFDLKYVNGAEHWYCNACECPIMGRVYYHENGKRHKMALGNQNQREKTPISNESQKIQMQIAPGEPIPPGFEEEIEKVAQIQERLDGFRVGPLVALEYLLELQDYDVSKEPTYLCILCDKKGDPRTVLTHLASYNHIIHYLQKHFPTCYRALAPYMTKQYKRNWQVTLHKVAEAIEKKFGRLKPRLIESAKFEKDRMYYLQMVAKDRHFTETCGMTFEELIVKEELTRAYDEPIKSYDENLPFRKTEQIIQKKRSPSPPIVENPIKKLKNNPSTSGNNSNSGFDGIGNRRNSLSSVSSISSSDLSDYDERRRSSPRRSPSSSTYRRRQRSTSPYRRRYIGKNEYQRRDKRGLMPWERSDYRKNKSDTSTSSMIKSQSRQDKMDEFRKLSKAIDNDMERILKQHRKNPEKHPQYNEEWKKFWNRRYKELQADGKDVANYDFKPEWIVYWNGRMVELQQDETKMKKEALRKRLEIPEEPTPISFRIQSKKLGMGPTKNVGSRLAITPTTTIVGSDDQDVIVIEDKDDESKSSRRSHSPWEDDGSPAPSVRRHRSQSKEHRRRISRSRSRSRSHERDYRRNYRPIRILPWDYRHKELPDYYKPPPIMRDATREPVLPPKTHITTPVESTDEPSDDDLNVVGVLRLLTALEERLGSLGPKIIDLLAQALALEKNEANSSETLLDNEVNCVLFETVKEKLKGQLLAGLVNYVQERAFKNAIKKVAELLHMAGERKKVKDEAVKQEPVIVAGVGCVDKTAIAKQIANALILQGKTDVSQDELEQLINAVVGMAEASRVAGKPVTTATFLEGLSKQNQMTSTVANPTIIMDDGKLDRNVKNDMESLSDSDLQTLLQNFKDLSTDEQHKLITYLKKLEAREPERVEKLRKFVNLSGGGATNRSPIRKDSPFSNRQSTGGVNPTSTDNYDTKTVPSFVERFDSDEDDYTFEDVVKAASKNVKEKELEKERELVEKTMQHEEKKIISSENLLNLPSTLAQTLNSLPVNLANLADIVGNVKNLTKKNDEENRRTDGATITTTTTNYSGNTGVPIQPVTYPNIFPNYNRFDLGNGQQFTNNQSNYNRNRW